MTSDDARPPLAQGKSGHACLAGPNVSRDEDLGEALRRRHRVTVVPAAECLRGSDFLSSVDVLVLECAGQAAEVFGLLRAFREHAPALVIVLVNGGLTQAEVARAFREGVKDYFRFPYDARLLAERVGHLVHAANRSIRSR